MTLIETALHISEGNLIMACNRTDPQMQYKSCDYRLLAREEFSTDEGNICGASMAKVWLGQREAVQLALFILENLAEAYWIDEVTAARDAVRKLYAKYEEEPKE